MLQDFEQIDQAELLSRVKCPVLIHGGRGNEERRYSIARHAAWAFYRTILAWRLYPERIPRA
jgi:hypothetical protein